MKQQNINKNHEIFTRIVIFGAIFIAFATLYLSYESIIREADLKTHNTAHAINQEITNNLSYIENLSNFIANQISNKKNISDSEIASILVNAKPRMNQTAQDILTWTLFDFINENNYVVASSSQGKLRKKPLIAKEERSWISEARITPWKLLHSEASIGIVSNEPNIPLGFGITKENGEFLGILSLGININKLQKRLETLMSGHCTILILTDKEGSVIFSSENLKSHKIEDVKQAITSHKIITDPLKIKKNTYYHETNQHQFHILVGMEHKIFLRHLRKLLIPKVFNTLYLTIFFLTLLYFLKTRFFKPITNISRAINQISQGKLDISIPQSKISEFNRLSFSIAKMKDFLVKEEDVKRDLKSSKDFAEDANYNKTEFLASTAHELKNMLAGIMGLGELLKLNLKEAVSKETAQEKRDENLSWVQDIIKLGEESSIFVNDILDVNQSQTGDFKIEKSELVDLQDISLRAINLLKANAMKEKKTILTNFDKKPNGKFATSNLDPRRTKQIIINLISNSLKYSNDGSAIEINLMFLSATDSEEVSDHIKDNILKNETLSEESKIQLLSLSSNRHDNRICLEIRDQGPGMTQEELQLVSQKYKTAASNSNKKIDSTGLGLPIVRFLVEAQGGLLIITSNKGEGTSAKVIF